MVCQRLEEAGGRKERRRRGGRRRGGRKERREEGEGEEGEEEEGVRRAIRGKAQREGGRREELEKRKRTGRKPLTLPLPCMVVLSGHHRMLLNSHLMRKRH